MKNTILIFLVLFNHIVKAQCSDYISTERDRITGIETTASKDYIIVSDDGGKTGFGLFLMNKQGILIISIKTVGASPCIKDEGKINLLFRDGTRVELINDNKFNCNSQAYIYLGSYYKKKYELGLFRTTELEAMRVWTSSGYVEQTLTNENSVNLLNTIKCLSDVL